MIGVLSAEIGRSFKTNADTLDRKHSDVVLTAQTHKHLLSQSIRKILINLQKN
jgi:hypothetical protein